MSHRCSHCDLTFEHDADKSDVVRCPKCLRTQGLEAVSGEASTGSNDNASGDSSGWRPNNIIVGVFAVAAAAVAWFYFAKPGVEDLPEEVPMRALGAAEVAEYLRREKIDEDLSGFFEAPSDLEGADAAELGAFVAERRKAGALVEWSRVRAHGDEVRTPEQVAQALRSDEKAKLYPLEVAWTAVQWLRDEGKTAMLAEIINRAGDRAPPDPSGRLGYYGVALGATDKAEVVDVYQGQKVSSSRLLSDVQAAAAILSLQAMSAFERGDAKRASSLASDAIDLDGKSPVVRSAYAETMLSGVAQDAIKEIEHAHNLRSDAPRRLGRAKVALATGGLDDADKIAARLADEYPDYASAHAMLSIIHLARHELDEAEAKLEQTAKLAPDFPELDLFRAELHAARSDLPRAADFARKALKGKHVRWQTRLRAAMLLRAAGDYDEMRRQAHAIMGSVPEQQRAIIRAQVEQLLGPTALEDPDALAFDTEEGDEGDLKLEGSSLLGDEEGLDVSLLDNELSTDLELDLGGSGGGGGMQLGSGNQGSGPRLQLE